MATVRIPDEQRTLTDQDEVTRYLATLGIDYERWPDKERVREDASVEEVLAAYAPEIEQLKQQGGYVTADVIDVTAQTPNLDAMLAKFSVEHWHDEDEVRYIVRGRGIFHIHPRDNKPVIALECEPGDLIRVPRGTGTGSISAATGIFGRSGCFRTRPAGHRTTPRAAPTRVISHCA